MKSPSRFARRATLAIVVGAMGLGGALSACGRVGPLEQPAPLLGADNKRDYYAAKEQREKEKAALGASTNTTGSAESGDDNAPLTTRDIKDPGQEIGTPRNNPVPGAPNPLGPTVSTTPYSR